jgi:putative DNA primase/helicase
VDHYEITRVESGKFKRYLGMLFYDNHQKVANAEAITNAFHVLQAKAENGDKTFPLSLRVTRNNDDILYDLSDDKWQCVKISKQNWEVLSNTPNPMFIKYNQIPQAYPDRNYEYDIFDSFLQLTNLKKEKDRILLKVYIISISFLYHFYIHTGYSTCNANTTW